MGALLCTGVVYFALSTLVKLKGVGILHKYFPPIVIGPVIMVIGLGLAPVAVDMALGKSAPNVEPNTAMMISMITLATTLIVAVFAKGLLKLVPILAGLTVGYLLSVSMGLVDFTKVTEAAWFSLPNVSAPEFQLEAIFYLLPIALAPAVEHLGDVMAISQVAGKDFMKNQGYTARY